MKDLFADLLERSRGRSALTPILPAWFEPAPPAQEPWGEVESFVAARPRHGAAPGRASESAEAPIPTSPEVPSSPSQAVLAPPPGQPREVVEHRVTAVAREVAALPTPATRDEIGPGPSLDIAAIVAEALRVRMEPPTVVESASSVVADGAEPSRERTATTVASAVSRRPAPVAPLPATSESIETRVQPPVIEVRIGRIEVTAAPPSRPAPVVRPSRGGAVGLSLGDYLARRSRR